jgi:hypothetical protein
MENILIIGIKAKAAELRAEIRRMRSVWSMRKSGMRAEAVLVGVYDLQGKRRDVTVSLSS